MRPVSDSSSFLNLAFGTLTLIRRDWITHVESVGAMGEDSFGQSALGARIVMENFGTSAKMIAGLADQKLVLALLICMS